jgi:hypothetical protein
MLQKNDPRGCRWILELRSSWQTGFTVNADYSAQDGCREIKLISLELPGHENCMLVKIINAT